MVITNNFDYLILYCTVLYAPPKNSSLIVKILKTEICIYLFIHINIIYSLEAFTQICVHLCVQ